MVHLLVFLFALLIPAQAWAPPYGFPSWISAVGNDLTLWGRTYDFNTTCGPFPQVTGIVSSCDIRVENTTLVWSDPVVSSLALDQAVLTTSASTGQWTVDATTTVDLAGIATIDLTVTNTGASDAFEFKASLTLDSTLDVYLRRHVEYDTASLTVVKGEIVDNYGAYTNDCFVFVPSLEVGDHTKTFEWIFDGDYDWLPVDRDAGCSGPCEPICTADSGGSPVLSVEPFPNSDQKTLASSGTWTERYIVVAHPTRPPLPHWRGLHHTNPTQIPGWWRPESESGRRFYNTVFPGNVPGATPHNGIPRLANTQAFKDEFAEGATDGIEMLPYGAGTRSMYLHPDWMSNSSDWAYSDQGRNGLNFVTNSSNDLDGPSSARLEFGKRMRNVDDDPWERPWEEPWVSGQAAIAAQCKGVDDPWDCCTGAGAGASCATSDMAYGYTSGCDNAADGDDEYPLKLAETLSAFLDPREKMDGFYHDFGNQARACTQDPRVSDPSHEVWFYDRLINYYRELYLRADALSSVGIVPSRPSHALNVIHGSGSPRALAAWIDVYSWGETLGDYFGGVNVANGCDDSGCADGACDDGTETCTRYDPEVASTCAGVDDPHPCCTGPGTAAPGVGCGYCPDYVGIGQDTLIAISKPNSGGIMGSMLAMAKSECVPDADSSSYWVRNIFTALYGIGITLGPTGGFGDSTNIQRQHWSILEDFGSLYDEDVQVTETFLGSTDISPAGGIDVTVYAHPSLTGCTGNCDKKSIVIAQNWTSSNITGASITLNDANALGMREGANDPNCARIWDPSTVTDSATETTAQWGAWSTASGSITGLSVAAKSYIAIEWKYDAACP